MKYSRLIVLVIAFEVFITCMVMLGIYFGFSIFLVYPANGSSEGNVTRTEFSFSVPMYMPSLEDLKVPYTNLAANVMQWNPISYILILGVMLIKSFVRGMYLGGLKSTVLEKRAVPLLIVGRHYFKRMLGWSFVQLFISGIAIVAVIIFPLLFFLAFLIPLVYILTPYIIVLFDCSLKDALAKAPGMLKRSFWRLFPLTLQAMICGLLVGMSKMLPTPLSYIVPLVGSTVLGTLLIAELLRKLVELMLEQRMKINMKVQQDEVKGSKAQHVLVLLSIPVLIFVGTLAFTGHGLHAMQIGVGKEERLNGLSYNADFSDVFYASKNSYTTYDWKDGNYAMDISLPDLSKETKPNEIRGIAKVVWTMDVQKKSVDGNHTFSSVIEEPRTSTIMYHLIQQSTKDGSLYYSSENGAVGVIGIEKDTYKPLSFYMMVSGDGKDVFIIQYPRQHNISGLFEISENGKYTVMHTSHTNPHEIKPFWFSKSQSIHNVLDMLSFKNKNSTFDSSYNVQKLLAAAMQEADGRMILNIFHTLQLQEVELDMKERTEEQWSSYLRDQYNHSDLYSSLQFLSKAGIQNGLEEREVDELSSKEFVVFDLFVPFPSGTITIQTKHDREDFTLRSLKVYE